MSIRFLPAPLIFGAALALLPAGVCRGEILFVDNMLGSDAYDGRSVEPTGFQNGPVKTIRRAMQLALTGDTINIANTGIPYYEAIRMVGPRHSGFEQFRFTVEGNGAVVSGARPIPADSWRKVGTNLWRMTPWRKGYYQLLLNGKSVPELKIPPEARALPDLPAGEWCAWRGSIYYRSSPVDSAPDLPFWFAADEVGLTLYNVSSVHVRDLRFEHFRLDGVNAHDLAREILLERVTCTGNARAGLAVGGSSSVDVRNCDLAGNRLHSLLLSEFGAADLFETNLDRPATIAPAP